MMISKDQSIRLSLLAVASLHYLVSSFQAVVPTTRVVPSTTRGTCLDGDRCRSSSFSSSSWVDRRHPRTSSSSVQRWSSLQDNDEDNTEEDDENSKKAAQDAAYDGLYEFLTRRTGEQAGESERKRKRSRIMDWMTSSKKSSSTNMVQPIRMEDGSVMEIEEDTTPRNTQARFDKLFSGMPTLDDILSSDISSGNVDAADMVLDASSSASPKKKQDDSWFEEESRQIQEEYQQILQEMKSQIAQQRAEDPENVPDNTEGIVEAIVNQEMERKLVSVKTERSKQRLQGFESDKMSDLDARDLTNAEDALVEQLLKESAEDWERRDALQAEVDGFLRYEKEAYSYDGVAAGDANAPQPGADLDSWTLQRLEKMLESSKSRSDDVSDILEEQIEDLKERIQKESKKGSIKPQTMKEWQMYRAIAARLGKEINDPESDVTIAPMLDSWREYIGKEEDIRKRSGLAVGPRMPFDWQRAARDPQIDELPSVQPPQSNENKSRREIRREVNMQAIQAMEELVRKSDNARAEGLKKQLELLKAELESRDYNDIEEEEVFEEALEGPVDLSDVFVSRDKNAGKKSTLPSTVYEDKKEDIDNLFENKPRDPSSYFGAPDIPAKQPPPNTPLFSDEDETENIPPPPNTPFFSDYDETDTKPPPPNTAFFSKDVSDVDPSTVVDTEYKLGSADEQKLRKMFIKAGARTKEEQDALREQWEAFQSLEKSKRDESGLTGGDSSLLDTADLKYDISDVMKGDGDFDAEKILSTIGPRPTRKKSSSTASEVPPESTKAKDSDFVAEGDSPGFKSSLEPGEVADSIYRSVSAVGGGRTKDDPEMRETEKADFEDYLKKENDLRQKMDSLDEDAASMAASMDVPIDGPNYAQDPLASIGPRPIFKRKKKTSVDEQELSDRGGILASEEDDDDEDDEDVFDDEPSETELSSQVDIVPDWLKKEREAMKKKDGYDNSGSGGFLGQNIDEVFEDDKYDHNIRQLHEYEQRRAGRNNQMGIDISDVLGRRGSDDYADYTHDRDYFRDAPGGWGAASFESRKNSLLEYVELTTAELNNLMDYKDSIYSTGVSQYLPRINKPFKEFGAIFRLEGVFVDLTGLHEQVWTKVAAELEFTPPVSEDIRRAAVTRPEIAVREIFYWANDQVLVNKAISSFRRIFREQFDQWAKDNGLVEETPLKVEEEEKGSMALFSEVLEDVNPEPPRTTMVPIDEGARMQRLKDSWSQTAEEFEFAQPTNEQLTQCSFLAPEIAVRDIFGWSSDERDIDAIVSVYKYISAEASGETLSVPASFLQQASEDDIDEGAILELQYLAWKSVAENNSLEVPSPDEVFAAAVLNDPEAVVISGFGWTENRSQASGLAEQYRDYFAEFLNDRVHHRSFEAPVKNQDIPVAEVSTLSNKGPTDEEILETQIEAWKKAAAVHSFTPPTADQVQLTINLSANDAVRRLLGWTYNFNNSQIDEISVTYEEAFNESSQKYINQYNLPIETVNVPTPIANGNPKKSVSADELYNAATSAWTNVAWQLGVALPDQEQVQFAMSVGPEDAIITGFQWTNDSEKVSEIVALYRDQIQEKLAEWQKMGYETTASSERENKGEDKLPLVSVKPGVAHWIKSLLDVEMGCGVASYLEEDQMNVLLEYAGLADILPRDKHVSVSNGYGRDTQQMLGVALRIERRADHCVVFDSSPYASNAAREVDMRSVALVGPYPRYELMSADTSSSSFDELTAMNIRRLFGERVYDQPELDMRQNQPEIRRKTKTRFWDPED